MKQIANFREYFLNPKGIKIIPTRNFQMPRPVEKLFDQSLYLHRAEKELEKNTVAFKLMPYKYSLTKPELKQYFEKLYGLQITKLQTLNYMGPIKRNYKNRRYRERDFKKVYVQLNEDVESFFQKIDK